MTSSAAAVLIGAPTSFLQHGAEGPTFRGIFCWRKKCLAVFLGDAEVFFSRIFCGGEYVETYRCYMFVCILYLLYISMSIHIYIHIGIFICIFTFTIKCHPPNQKKTRKIYHTIDIHRWYGGKF